jgi:proteasome alpha subunit
MGSSSSPWVGSGRSSFEIYDRIGMGGIGHPGDIERLRMAAIEVTSTEGFARSAHDVSLRRLANYSLSPALKAAFEQIYGAPYLARLLFAELGRGQAPNLFVTMEYDGAIHTNGGPFSRLFQEFAVISGTSASAELMRGYLASRATAALPLGEALLVARDAWAVGHLAISDPDRSELPSPEQLTAHHEAQKDQVVAEAAILDATSSLPATWRTLSPEEIQQPISARI